MGYSGNPRGRPCGVRNRATLLAEAMLADETENLVKRAVERALEGDVWALRLCLERVLAPRRKERVQFRTVPLFDTADARHAIMQVATAAARGELAPSEAAEVAQSIETFTRARKSVEQAVEYEAWLDLLRRDPKRLQEPPRE